MRKSLTLTLVLGMFLWILPLAGATATGTSNPLVFHSLDAPCVAFDTRPGPGSGAGPLISEHATLDSMAFDIVGAPIGGPPDNFESQGGTPGGCGIPGYESGNPITTAVLMNLVAINPSAGGNLRAYPTDATGTGGIVNYQGLLSHNLNNSNAFTLPVRQDTQGQDITIEINGAAGSTVHARGIILGYFTPASHRVEHALGDHGFVSNTVSRSYLFNGVSAGVIGATISGGGAHRHDLGCVDFWDITCASGPNWVSGSFGTVGGGADNLADSGATVAGGVDNEAAGGYSTISGGKDSIARGLYSTVGGGSYNGVYDNYGTIAGGEYNSLRDNYGAVGGGAHNRVGASSGLSAEYATIGGGRNNTAAADYATIGGGGPADPTDVTNTNNRVFDDYGTISGGGGNRAGSDDADPATARSATVGGGVNNTAGGRSSTVAGGTGNTASGEVSQVGGGWLNTAAGLYAMVGGGGLNAASNTSSSIGGGYGNTAGGFAASVGGGSYNQAGGAYATISGGGPSEPADSANTNNRVYDDYGTIGGGGYNRVGSDDGATQDPTNATFATVAGGSANTATGTSSTVGGGTTNNAAGDISTVGGGWVNNATGLYSWVGGGGLNAASNTSSSVGGGYGNTAEGFAATVPGGSDNTASGEYSWAGGQSATADDNHSFVWSGDAAGITSGQVGQFMIDAPGGVWIEAESHGFNPVGLFVDTTSTTDGIAVYGKADSTNSAVLAKNSGSGNLFEGLGATASVFRVDNDGDVFAKSYTPPSDRNVKENFAAIDSAAILQAVAALPIETWNYIGDDPAVRHLGPMAQDFAAAFDMGDPEVGFTTIDADGVALAAIQGLYAQVQDLEAGTTSSPGVPMVLLVMLMLGTAVVTGTTVAVIMRKR